MSDPPATFTILIVEDEFASLEVLTIMLEAKGYRVIGASDGEEALRLLGENHVDLMITDYMMPNMDGIMLCDEMAKDSRFENVPVIMMSATELTSIPKRRQVRALFGKPLLFSVLLEKVRSLVDETSS